MMINLDFNQLLEKAAKRHGHLCPSLYFGVSCAYHALRALSRQGKTLQSATLNGSSKCIRDGSQTVLDTLSEKIEAHLQPEGKPVGIIINSNDNSTQEVFIKERVKAEINRLKDTLSLEEFQEKGVAYLRSLSTDEFLDI